ncbi:hypothetical protein ACFYOV_08320 [Streptomyces sp. NPDC005931]|uniref:hypothetical protein n=1 Tax=Streptomyces sp. NPDC005931 TaxID=3364737 RepID=UPI00369C72D1
MAAVWATVFPLIAAPEPHRLWGMSAGLGYLCAAVAARSSHRCGRAVSVWFAVTGAVVVPFALLVLTGAAQSEVGVVERSGLLTLRQFTPYLAEPRTVVEVTPYLPGMAVFGVPRALLGDGGPLPRLLGDARLWCATAFLGCLWAARRRRGTGPAALRSPPETRSTDTPSAHSSPRRSWRSRSAPAEWTCR